MAVAASTCCWNWLSVKRGGGGLLLYELLASLFARLALRAWSGKCTCVVTDVSLQRLFM